MGALSYNHFEGFSERTRTANAFRHSLPDINTHLPHGRHWVSFPTILAYVSPYSDARGFYIELIRLALCHAAFAEGWFSR